MNLSHPMKDKKKGVNVSLYESWIKKLKKLSYDTQKPVSYHIQKALKLYRPDTF